MLGVLVEAMLILVLGFTYKLTLVKMHAHLSWDPLIVKEKS